jgi:hypothetical protein
VALLDPPGILPTAMWAVSRALLTEAKPIHNDVLRATVSPEALRKTDTFDFAIQGLRELRLIQIQEDSVALTDDVRKAKPSGFASFAGILRDAAFAEDGNRDIAANREQRGPRDLTRALCWFLSQDPLAGPLTWAEVQQRQANALPDSAGPAVINDTRWNMLTHWAPALGLAESPLTRTTGLVPDVTRAVRASIRDLGNGTTTTAAAFVGRVKARLPVLVDGRWATELGITTTDTLDASTSHALLRLHDEGWLRLDREADAASVTVLQDPDGVDGHRVVSHITYLGNPDA